jgi:hypothetical protein
VAAIKRGPNERLDCLLAAIECFKDAIEKHGPVPGYVKSLESTQRALNREFGR